MDPKLLGLAVRAVLGGLLVMAAPQAANPSTGPASTSASAAPAALADPVKGGTIFLAQCANCHGAGGTGAGIGPPLKGEVSRKNTAATISWIKNPQPPMPKLFPSPPSDADVVKRRSVCRVALKHSSRLRSMNA